MAGGGGEMRRVGTWFSEHSNGSKYDKSNMKFSNN